METKYLQSVVNTFREFFDFLIGVDEQATAVLTEAMRDLWNELLTFFSR